MGGRERGWKGEGVQGGGGGGGGGAGGKVAEPLLMTRSIKVLLTGFHLRPSLEISAANVSLHSCRYESRR